MSTDAAGSYPEIAAVILAAGSSSRMGQPKQLLEWQGKTLLEGIVAKVKEAGTGEVFVVLGAKAQKIIPVLEDQPITLVENPDWERGMGTSVVAGVRAAMASGADAALVVLVDQPYVSVALLRDILQLHREHPKALIVSDYGTHSGVPALFPAFFFPELLLLKGDEGARKIIKRYSREKIAVSFPEGNLDLDTPEDWNRLISEA